MTTAPEPPGLRRKRGALSILLWIGSGLAFAAAVVTAALVLRPEPAAVLPASVSEASAPVAPTPAAAVVATESAPLAGVGSVRLRVGPGFLAERRDAIVAALAAAGIKAVQIEPLPFEVATSRVGYYRGEDRTAAEGLAALVSPVLGGADIGIRDYGQLLDNAEPGRLDLWVSGGA